MCPSVSPVIAIEELILSGLMLGGGLAAGHGVCSLIIRNTPAALAPHNLKHGLNLHPRGWGCGRAQAPYGGSAQRNYAWRAAGVFRPAEWRSPIGSVGPPRAKDRRRASRSWRGRR